MFPSLSPGTGEEKERLTRTVGVVALILPVTAVTDAVTDQLRVDADVGVALESLRTAECL